MLISSQKYECEMRACPSPGVYLQSKQKKKNLGGKIEAQIVTT